MVRRMRFPQGKTRDAIIGLFGKRAQQKRLYSLSPKGGVIKVRFLHLLVTSLVHSWAMPWLWLVGSIKLYVSFAKEPYKRDGILQKRPIIESILLTAATPY